GKTVDVPALKTGVYLLRINDNNKITNFKLFQ
ncbi:MAG: hypothetical protein QG594_316, partial [Bacteroidota bacterium]|nr:hypothetical protein [Bacteroidota bacterium]